MIRMTNQIYRNNLQDNVKRIWLRQSCWEHVSWHFEKIINGTCAHIFGIFSLLTALQFDCDDHISESINIKDNKNWYEINWDQYCFERFYLKIVLKY